jgi:HK97 family phage prohead protease
MAVADEARTDTPPELEELAREFGVVPGVPRHGETAMRWDAGASLGVREKDERLGPGYLGVLNGHFCVFNRWTEIDSFFEGRFMEQIAPGACKKTFEENRRGMRCMLQHGRDPQFGMKPLGPIRELEEDDIGGRYEVGLLDTALNRDLLPALKEELYGASFRFQVLREEVVNEPPRSEHNPEGIEERTITEMRVREFGPVTFPAYEDATAGVRSINDWWLDLDLEIFSRGHPDAFPERLAELLASLRSQGRPSLAAAAELREDGKEKEASAEAPTQDAPSPRAPDAGRRSLRTTHLSGAAHNTLRTTQEDPPWKLS